MATFPRRPMLVMTGGDPLKRADLFDLIRHAVAAGLQVALTPSATPLATFEAFARGAAGRRATVGHQPRRRRRRHARRLPRLAGQLRADAGDAPNARELEMAVQVNTTITRRNVEQIDAMAELLPGQGIAMWSVFFLVPVGRGVEEERISPEEYETGLRAALASRAAAAVRGKDDRSPALPAVRAGAGGDPLAGPQGSRRWRGPPRPSAPLGVGDGKGVMFVSHTGEIFPAGFLPCAAAAFRKTPWSMCTRSIPCFWPSAIPIGLGPLRHLRVSAASAAAAAPGRTP